ncbi:MAG TPA: SprT family zinc-dependent metalloprotease [Burkholderiales bacterium]|nr:SprT family zinc-dependent metalloprotease [Burkholderiales bacterium]
MRLGKLLQFELPFGRPAPAEPVATRHIALEGVALSYQIRRSRRRRNIVITIDEDGVRVGAPWRASERSIANVLLKNAQWVVRTWRDWQQRRPERMQWRDGETLYYLGAEFVLHVVERPSPPELDDGELRIGVDPGRSAASLEADVVGWLRARALERFRERANAYAAQLGIPVPVLRLSSARTRWGSCSASGGVRLNWRLIQMPPELIDYVVAHELAHLLQMNHSRRFWAVVARLVPDHAAARLRLKTEGYRYLRA